MGPGRVEGLELAVVGRNVERQDEVDRRAVANVSSGEVGDRERRDAEDRVLERVEVVVLAVEDGEVAPLARLVDVEEERRRRGPLRVARVVEPAREDASFRVAPPPLSSDAGPSCVSVVRDVAPSVATTYGSDAPPTSLLSKLAQRTTSTRSWPIGWTSAASAGSARSA